PYGSLSALFLQAEDGIRARNVTGVQTCALPIFRDQRTGRPTVVLATTNKGRGTSFTEGTYTWHNGVPTPEQMDQAAAELGIDGASDDETADQQQHEEQEVTVR